MNIFNVLSVGLGIIGSILVLYMFMLVLIVKASIEWKVTRFLTTIFTALTLWSMCRFLNRIPSTNIYDYLILLFNLGLLVVGYKMSRNIE